MLIITLIEFRMQPREISTTPANMFAALFTGPNIEGSGQQTVVTAVKGEEVR